MDNHEQTSDILTQPPAAPGETAPSEPMPAPTPLVIEPPPGRHHARQHKGLRKALGGIWNVIVRIYAFGLFLLVLWPGYLAVTYLFQTVFVPTPVPKRFLEWQGSVDVAALRQTNVPGVTGDAARAPLGHYHRVERWFQPDPLNGCTISGCHEPLPHTKKMKVPAFANFHTTFLACQMCHMPAPQNATDKTVAWVSLATGKKQDPPALLRLLRYMENDEAEIKNNPQAAHPKMVELLRSTLAVTGNVRPLNDLLIQLETADPGSPVWRRAVERAMVELPLHARGEYGAKLARDTNGGYRAYCDQLATLAKRYFENPADRGETHRTIHAPLLKEPLACVSCHGNTPATLDFESLGYSTRRSNLLSHLQLASLMQQIREGQQFHIFKLMGGPNGQ